MKHNLNLYRHWCSPTVKLALVDYQIVWDYQEIEPTCWTPGAGGQAHLPWQEWPACKPPKSPGFPNSSALGGGPRSSPAPPKVPPGYYWLLGSRPNPENPAAEGVFLPQFHVPTRRRQSSQQKVGASPALSAPPPPRSLSPGAPPWQGWRPCGLSASLLPASSRSQARASLGRLPAHPPLGHRGQSRPAGARGRPAFGSRLDSWAFPQVSPFPLALGRPSLEGAHRLGPPFPPEG